MNLTVNKSVVVKDFIWLLSIVYIDKQPCTFWSYHKLHGMPQDRAEKYFEQAHFKEVSVLVQQKIDNEKQSKILIS